MFKKSYTKEFKLELLREHHEHGDPSIRLGKEHGIQVLYEDGGIHMMHTEKIHVNLKSLSKILYLLIRLRDIFRVGRLGSHKSHLAKKTVESRNGTGVPTPEKFHPENNQTIMRIASVHIGYELDFLRSVLVRVMMWSSGTIPEGFDSAIIAPSPSVNILTVGFIFYGSFRAPILFNVFN